MEKLYTKQWQVCYLSLLFAQEMKNVWWGQNFKQILILYIMGYLVCDLSQLDHKHSSQTQESFLAIVKICNYWKWNIT